MAEDGTGLATASGTLEIRLPGDAPVTVTTSVVMGSDPLRDGFAPIALGEAAEGASRNHATVVPCDELVEVTDLGSAAGTSVMVNGVDVALVPWEPTHVTLPCVLLLGECCVELSAAD